MPQYFFNIYSIPYWITFLISLTLALILFLKKRGDKRVQLYTAAMFGIAIFSFAAAMERIALERRVGEIWISINYIVAILSLSLIYHFSHIYQFKTKPFENKKILIVYLIPVFFLIFVIMGNLPRIRTDYAALGLFSQSYNSPYSYFYPLFYFAIGFLLVGTTYNFIKMYRQTKDLILRKQAAYFIYSFMVILIGVIIVAFLLLYSIRSEWELTMIFLSASLTIITVGIMKQDLFDIEFIIKKTFVYTAMVFPLVAMFRLIELGLGHFVSFTFFAGDVTARLIAAAIVAGCFFPLRALSIKMSDKLFPKLTKTIKIENIRETMVYKKQLEFALKDGGLGKKENEMLKALREDLHISDEEHNRLKKEILHKKKNM